MALQCNMTLNVASMTAGQTPPPQATLTVYNPNAVAVQVTGATVKVLMQTDMDVDENPNLVGVNMPLVPTGPGMTTLVPALGTITMGPFPIAVNSAANANGFQAVNAVNFPFAALNPQGSSYPFMPLLVGATVMGSDGSVNEAGQAGLLVGYQASPPLGFQGGFLQFNGPANFLLGLMTGTV